MASGQGPGSSPLQCTSKDYVDLSSNVAAAGNQVSPSVMLNKGLDTMRGSNTTPPISGTSLPVAVAFTRREPESQAYLQLLHSWAICERQLQGILHVPAAYAAGACTTPLLAQCQVSQQKKPRTTEEQIMNHLRANPTMSMTQSRKVLGIGHKRYISAKAKMMSTDDDIRKFHSSNPTATHKAIKKALHVGIECFRKVTASAPVSGTTSTPGSLPKTH